MPLRGLLESELRHVCDRVVEMGDRVEQAILLAAKALEEQDVELAQTLIHGDQAINQLRFEIEESCTVLLATQFPTAIDLRTVVTALNIITDLERMGDHAKGIGQLVVRIQGEDQGVLPHRIPRMARMVCDMLHAALDAFVDEDAAAAQRVCEADDEVDHTYREVFEGIIQAMISREYSIRTGMNLLFAAHNFERIGDRTTNIGERIIFMVTGVMEERNW